MKKNVNMKIAVQVMLGVLVLAVILKASGLITFKNWTRIGFVGNDGIHSFNGSYAKITGTMSHNIRPSKDSDSVHCEITTKSGTLHVVISRKDNGEVLLDKDISGDETFDVTAGGTVRVELSTEEHSGSYRFKY